MLDPLDSVFSASRGLAGTLGKTERPAVDRAPRGLIDTCEFGLLHEKELQGRESSEPLEERAGKRVFPLLECDSLFKKFF